MNLGQLINRLERSPSGNEVIVSTFGHPQTTVGGVCSYRGFYSQLAIEPVQKEKPTTVADLLDTLRDAVGKTFTGYKGGEYVMDRDTPVWVSEYGCSSGLQVYAVEDVGGIDRGTRIVLLLNQFGDELLGD